jgi:hypothetical protein
MIWHSIHTRHLETIARTAFFTSLVAYIVFWLADLIVPGFVSRYFSVHLFLLVSVVFGLLWSRAMTEYEERPLVQLYCALALGAVFSILVWFACDVAGGYRILLVVSALLSPVCIFRILSRL